MAAKKSAAKKSAKKAPAAKSAKKASVKKSPAKKSAAKKSAAKKSAAKKSAAKKSAAKKAPAKKAAAAEKTPPKAVAKTAAKKTGAGAKKTAAGKKPTAFVLKQQRRLLELRDGLVDAMSGVAGEIRNGPEGSEASGSGMHQGDAGSDAYDRDFALSVLAKEQDALYEIEQALRRIEKGNYGICELSGDRIPQERLEAIPFARLTVECQAQWEKEYGKRRFRPKSEVGFSNGEIPDDDSEAVSLDEAEE